MEHVRESTKSLRLLSELLLPRPSQISSTQTRVLISELSQSELEEMRDLATSHHVIIRTFGRLEQILECQDKATSAAWVSLCVQDEMQRISYAVQRLEPICRELDNGGCRAVVIKSL